ncbi:MAG TPA: hypothetical protein VH062_21595, partial [Polyangiaceae bacterium]|nr:hypothetical protein [Polyangiaceae bacterium]
MALVLAAWVGGALGVSAVGGTSPGTLAGGTSPGVFVAGGAVTGATGTSFAVWGAHVSAQHAANVAERARQSVTSDGARYSAEGVPCLPSGVLQR